MKLKARNSIYVPDFIGILVAFTYVIWSLRGKKHHKCFIYAVWFSFVLFFDFLVNILGKWFQGGLFVYNLCIIQDLFNLCKGYLFFQMNFSGLDRIFTILKLMTKKEKITRANKYVSLAFLSMLGIYFAYAEFSIFEKENITLIIKPHTYTYANLSIERLTNFFNSFFYLLSFIASLEIFLRLKKQNFLFLAGSAIYLILSLNENFMDPNYLEFGTSLFEAIGLYFVLWGLSSITKREEYIMMIYD